MNQFKNDDISSKEVENAVKSMSTEEIEAIEKEWGKNKEESNDNSNAESNADDEKTENISADPKDKSEFAKQFGPMIMKDFRQNMGTLFDLIVKEAKELKEVAEEIRKEEAAKAQQKSESTENEQNN
jgi:hypothetical protein